MPMTVSGVGELIATLGELPAEMKAALKPAVLEAGNIVGAQAKSNAGFSSYIPSAISVSSSFSVSGAGAKITVTERGFPHQGEVRTYEGNGVNPTPFRHPVYGNRDAWATGVTHPFLHTALKEKQDEAVEVIAAAVASVIASNGL
jgi:hypothetical protein